MQLGNPYRREGQDQSDEGEEGNDDGVHTGSEGAISLYTERSTDRTQTDATRCAISSRETAAGGTPPPFTFAG
ncbi:hypothetical protein L810_5480 [Burkholderia sp. AU4i]|nr:hypothetical protein L810_5480 [Burkholderia sp. AU4i]